MDDDEDISLSPAWSNKPAAPTSAPSDAKVRRFLPVPDNWEAFLVSQRRELAWRLAIWLLHHHHWKRELARPIRLPPKLWEKLGTDRKKLAKLIHIFETAGLISIEQLGPGKVTVVKVKIE